MLSIRALVQEIFSFYSLLLVIYCLLTWIPRRTGGFIDDVATALDTLVGPYLGFFRRILPSFDTLDFSPVIALIALNLIERLVLTIIV